MKHTILAIGVALVALLLLPQIGEGQRNDVRAFMRAKLDHSKGALHGLTTEDYDLIGKHAGALTALSQDTDWNVLQDAEYRRLSGQFRRNTGALAKAAKAKNLDSATLAYVQVTLSCVECHKHVRKVQNGDEG